MSEMHSQPELPQSEPPPALVTSNRWSWAGLLLLAGCLLVLNLHARTFLPFFPDDSYISLRYSERLLEGKGLTWTDGERVEGYSNLLWVLVVAAGGLFADNLVAVARVLGHLAMSAVLVAIFWRYRPARADLGLPALFASLAFAASTTTGAWTIGGLEQALLAGLLAWAVVLSYPAFDGSATTLRELWLPGLLYGLVALTRPDGILFAGVAAGYLVLRNPKSTRAWRAALMLSVLPALLLAAQMAFRRVYYDALVPNTYHAKVAFRLERLGPGLLYFLEGVPYHAGLVLAAAVAVILRRRSRGPALALLLMALAWSAYVVSLGGDHFAAHRHYMPVLVLLALMSAELFVVLCRKSPAFPIAATAAAAVLLAQMWIMTWKDPSRQTALDDTWHFSGEPVGKFLRHAFERERPLLALDSAGALAFYYELPTLDMLGLNDRWIAEHPPPWLGTKLVGHELGDGAYVLRRKPALVAFWTPLGGKDPAWLSGRQMVADPEFASFYQLVAFETPAWPEVIRTQLWVRREDSPIGIVRAAERIDVPGFLLASDGRSIARLDDEDRLGTVVTEGPPVQVALQVPAGRWHIEAEARGRVARVSAWLPPYAEPSGVDFDWAGGEALVVISIETEPGQEAHVRGITLTRR